MMYVLMVRYLKPYAEVEPFFPAHREFLKKHYDSGEFIVSGVMESNDGGIIVAKIEGGSEAVEALIAEDPFTKEGLARYEVTAFKALWAAPRLERLKQ